VITTRAWLTEQLTKLGFHVFASQTNFLLVRPPVFGAEQWLAKLRERKILVRWFSAPEVRDYLRISIGTDSEASALIKAAKAVLR
jgi:histidinol-phosphate aminotransferase